MFLPRNIFFFFFELENQPVLAHKADLGDSLKVSVLNFSRGHICGRKVGQEESAWLACYYILKSQPGAQRALWEVVQDALEREWMTKYKWVDE